MSFLEGDEWMDKPAEPQPLVTRITPFAHRTVNALESARVSYALIPLNAKGRVVEQGYSYLHACRRDLYLYIAELERIAGIQKRTITLRF